MSKIGSAVLKIAASAAMLTAVASPALAQQRWDNDRDSRYGRDYRHDNDRYDRHVRLHGPGVGYLYPVLRNTERGSNFVIWQVDRRHDGYIRREDALRANRALMRMGDRNRDGHLSNREIRYALSRIDDRGDRYGSRW